jgi:hypothetical protein
MVAGVDDTVAALTFFNALASVVSIIDEAFQFRENCRQLRDGCNVIQLVISQNQELLKDHTAIEGLTNAIKECHKYLEECRTRKFLRNPIFEVTFHKRIKKYRRICKDWTSKALLSLHVRRQ